MDDGLLRRLGNICKNYYTLNTIDDLFLYAGVKQEWYIEQQGETVSGTMRFSRCYGWVAGIKQHAPDKLDISVGKVINEILKNPGLREQDRAALTDSLKDLDLREKSNGNGLELEPLLATLARSLANDGFAKEVAILASAEARLDWTDYNNGSNTDFHNLILAVPYKTYEQIKIEIEACEEVIYDHVWPLLIANEQEKVHLVRIVCKLVEDDKWRDKALAWLTGQNVNNQGRVRSDNVASRLSDGLQFRSEPEIYLYKALKTLGVSFAPLPVFVRGGEEYRRIEPDFVILKEGIIVIVEVDGDTFHRETPAEAYNRTTMLENEGARIIHVQAKECDSPEKAAVFARRILQTITKLKEARR